MAPKNLLPRPPIVAVLGHVDHGKTSLLDKIRKTRVAEKEPGGITQTIGASQVDFKGKKITFVDTPGHAAFSEMRARGAQVTDMAILVVAANDGVMPQTIESIEHIRAAKIPFLVAVNKIDLPGVEVEKVKAQLADNGVKVEGYGGDIVAMPVSAKTGQGIEELLEMILLLAEMEGIKADPAGELEAVVIESKKDNRGPIGTVIVKNGTLRIGEKIAAEHVSAKVRGLMDEKGKPIKEAEPGRPVEILGFEEAPPVGAKVIRVGEISPSQPVPPAAGPEKIKTEENKLNLILKADSLGTLGAIKGSLGEEVLLVHAGIGDITESDIFLAKTTRAEVIGFRVKISPPLKRLAEEEKVIVKTEKIIYELLDYLAERVLKILEPTIDREIMTRARVIAEFNREEKRIAGCLMMEGKIRKGNKVHLERGGKIVGEARITTMKHQKENISETRPGMEFGAVFAPPLDFKTGDMLISFKPVAKPIVK